MDDLVRRFNGDDPDVARALWDALVAAGSKDATASMVLQWVFESVLVDMIGHHVQTDDTYALVIGRRIASTLKRISQAAPANTVTTA
jgi:hypothetical protein